MPAEALNCPNCGAGVASDSSACKFCKTRLKTVACTSCFRLIFVGARFCDHCGAIAAPVNVSLEDTVGDCPRCRVGLELLMIDSTHIRSCTSCDGLWMDDHTFETVCSNRERQASVLTFFERRTLRGIAQTKVNYVPCPDCGELMNRSNFAKASGVIVDICKQHGVWFDSDELPAIVAFIEKGGLDIARERQITQLKNERARLRSEQHFPNDEKTSQFDANPDVLSFVRSLFD